MSRFHLSERPLLILLVAVQFTHIMDFMLVMPLGPQLMRVFAISAAQFSMLIAAYAMMAGIVGLLVAPFIDRFDRRSVLVAAYAGINRRNVGFRCLGEGGRADAGAGGLRSIRRRLKCNHPCHCGGFGTGETAWCSDGNYHDFVFRRRRLRGSVRGKPSRKLGSENWGQCGMALT